MSSMKSSSKNKVFNKLLDIMKEFDRVCKKYDLEYSLHAGTLLGAIRHDGFIPWDDDVDLIMKREDYNKLKEIGPKAFKDPYFFQSPETDPGSPRMLIRIRDTSTTSVSSSDVLYKMNNGIFIDIFPSDYFPNSVKESKKMVRKIRMYSYLAGGYARYYAGIGAKYDGISFKLFYYTTYLLYKFGIITSKKMFYKFEKEISKYNEKDCLDRADSIWLLYDDSYHFPKKCLDCKYILHKFEDYKFPICSNYDEFLKFQFGDYMTPVKAPSGHGDLIQKVDISYKDFIKEHYLELVKMFKH